MVKIRPIEPADAEPFAAIYVANREFLAPFEPDRAESYYTPAGQREMIDKVRADPRMYRCVIEVDDEPVGMITLSVIERGPAQSANLGYWVAQAANGKGIATAATALMVRVAFDEFNLHRLQAGTLPDNVGSQKVLARNGFQRIGLAPAYLRIAGRWQDHVLFQLINDEWEPA